MLESPRSPNVQNEWPTLAKGYKLISAIGKGYFGIVWKAEVAEGRHKGQQVAIKKLDLEKCGNTKIDDIRKNILLINLLDHPNILSHKASFLNNKDLWIVLEIMEGGSVDNIIQYNFPNGLKDQALIASLLKEALQGLKYLHQNNQIHRDIKAANILIGLDGSVKISDFGVAAKLKEGKKRNTFIGSPCWMAPEILDQDKKIGYDSKIDLWSLGITALELAQGKPPNSELTTMKVQLILKTLNEEPPKLAEEPCWDDHFREFLSFCLTKDPTKRKSAEELLKCCKSFFGKAKGKEYIKEKLLKGLGPLESRVDQQTIELAQAEINGSKLKKSNTLEPSFSFHFFDKEDEDDMSDLIDQNKVQICKSHLPKIESEMIMRRTLSNLSIYSQSEKEPHSAGYIKKETVVDQGLSKFSQKQKSEKLLICKGDAALNEFNFLGEDEM